MTAAFAAPAAAATAAPVLELVGVVKRYGAVTALKGVSLAVQPGRIHGLVGENGAGKSTLIGVASGVVRADEGEVRIAGRTVSAPTVPAMRRHGIAVVHQHPALPPDLTVAEVLDLAVATAGAAPAASVEDLLAEVTAGGMGIGPRQRIAELTVAQRHVVEIAKALASRSAILVLDEPTEAFGAKEVAHLFALLRRLAGDGVAILYISHRLHEVLDIVGTVSFLRDGALVATRPRPGLEPAEMVTLIAGRPMDRLFPAKSRAAAAMPVMTVEDLAGRGFGPVGLALGAGEIAGLAGIEGQGQRAFLRALAGLGAVSAGTVRVAGRAVPSGSRAGAADARIAFVTDDRHGEGLFMPWTIRANISLGALATVSRGALIDRRAEDALAAASMATLGVKAPSGETPVANLSGGNQQKVLFAREVAAAPLVLLVDEPTKGVDVGARLELYAELRRLADAGTAVLVSAADGLELEGLCDRVHVFSRGRIVEELAGGDVTEQRIAAAMIGRHGPAETGSGAVAPANRSRFFVGDHFPIVPLVAMTAAVGGLAAATGDGFLSAYNLSALLALLAILALLSAGQLATFLVGGIDLAVGPVAGLAVVLASFLPPDATAGTALAAAGLILGVSLAIGLLHAVLILYGRVSAVVVTLATFVGLQGIALLLRPQPEGMVPDAFVDLAKAEIAAVPVGMWAALAIVVALQAWLGRSRSGRAFRAVGSDPAAAFRMGLSRTRAVCTAYMLSAGLAGLAGLLLAAEIGIGSAGTGNDYSLTSITAVVVSGAAVSGGRGSFLAVLAAAAMIQTIINVTGFLNIDSAWQYWLVGGATLVGAFAYGRLRRGAKH
jgi:ribose transport system ATP-binding protein